MAQEKIKLISKAAYIAEAQRPDGSIVRFSRTNSSWYDYGIGSRAVGDEVLVDISISEQGNPYITRLTADKYTAVLKIENMLIQRNILSKQEASL